MEDHPRARGEQRKRHEVRDPAQQEAKAVGERLADLASIPAEVEDEAEERAGRAAELALAKATADHAGVEAEWRVAEAEVSQAEARLARWLQEGKIKAIVDIVDGLDKAPQALIGLFEGRNKGKMAVRV